MLKNKEIVKQFERDQREMKRLFEDVDTFETSQTKSDVDEQNAVVIIPATDKQNDPDVILTKDSFSQFIIGLNELDVLEITDMDAAVAGECMLDLDINISATFSDDGMLEYIRIYSYENEHHRQVPKHQTYTELPDCIECIPGFDAEQFFYESQNMDYWAIRVKMTYSLQGGWYDEEEERYTQDPDLVNVKIKEMYIQKGTDVSQYFVQDLLDKEAYDIIKKICEEYMDSNIEAII